MIDLLRRRCSPGPARLAALLALCAIGLPACSGPGRVADANDQLRKENLQLRRQVDELQQKAELRVAELERLQQQVNNTQPPAVEGAVPPLLTKLNFDRLTGAIDTNSDRADDTVRLYLRPLDQQGRFLVVAGKADVQFVALSPGRDPLVLAQKSYDAKAFDAAYRTGLTGTHYTLELALPAPLPEGVSSATISVHFTDAATGALFKAERVIPIARGR